MNANSWYRSTGSQERAGDARTHSTEEGHPNTICMHIHTIETKVWITTHWKLSPLVHTSLCSYTAPFYNWAWMTASSLREINGMNKNEERMKFWTLEVSGQRKAWGIEIPKNKRILLVDTAGRVDTAYSLPMFGQSWEVFPTLLTTDHSCSSTK